MFNNWGSHSIEYENYCLLGCHTMQSDYYVLTFWIAPTASIFKVKWPFYPSMEDSVPEYQNMKNAHIMWIMFLLIGSTPWELLCSHLHSSSLVSCTELFQSPSLGSLLSYLLEMATWNINKVILFSYLHQHSRIKTWKINHKQLFPSSLEG